MFEMLLGHLVGDYLFQNDWMALNKQKHKGLGWLTCTCHCVMYTMAVCAFMNDYRPQWIIAVFLSHFIIDRWGLSELWGQIVGGRTIGGFLNDEDSKTYSPHMALRASINVFVYIVRDNTMHLTLMWLAYKLLENV